MFIVQIETLSNYKGERKKEVWYLIDSQYMLKKLYSSCCNQCLLRNVSKHVDDIFHSVHTSNHEVAKGKSTMLNYVNNLCNWINLIKIVGTKWEIGVPQPQPQYQKLPLFFILYLQYNMLIIIFKLYLHQIMKWQNASQLFSIRFTKQVDKISHFVLKSYIYKDQKYFKMTFSMLECQQSWNLNQTSRTLHILRVIAVNK